MIAKFDFVVTAAPRGNSLSLADALPALRALPRLYSLRLDGTPNSVVRAALPSLDYINGVQRTHIADNLEAAMHEPAEAEDEEMQIECVLERVWRVAGSYRTITPTSDRTEKTWYCIRSIYTGLDFFVLLCCFFCCLLP